jgi:subtilisin family serine protease
MNRKIVYLARRPEMLYRADCTVLETYCFDDDFAAAYVEFDDEIALLDSEGVIAVEEPMPVEPQWELTSVSESPDAVATIEDVRRLHDVPTGSGTGEGITVVAMDSGVDTSHPVFADAEITQVDVTGDGKGDEVGHGTGVLGQVTRLAPEAELISLRIFGNEGQTETNVIMRAYEWLHNNVERYDVVNMSWGSRRTSQQIDRVHNRLVRKGVRDVVAAGNSGDPAGSPATAEEAFGVGACTVEGKMAEFSSYNPDRDNPDLAAIGKDCRLAQADGTAMGTDLDGPWVKASGTSFSAPEVAGMVAKFFSARSVEPSAAERAFEAAARDIPDQPKDGAGIVDYRGALREAGGSTGPSPPDESNPDEEEVVFSLGDRQVAVLDAECLDEGFYETACEDDDDRGTLVRFTPSDPD